MLKKISERCIAPAASPMIKDIKTQNENALPSDRVMAKLHADFPQCFTNEGKFDLEKFKTLLNDKVDVTEEGYDLNFLGKNYANLIASTETETVIQPDLEHNSKPENKDSQNIYISGDNLDALKHLLKSYAGKIKCIYIDPPYNTGSDGFVYNDKFNFTAEQLQTKLGIGEEKAKRILDLCKRGSASHSAWLMFMAPRLMLARDLLTEDGVIFISIDDNEQANLKLLCDSIFGEDCFAGQFIWRKKDGGGQAKETFVNEHEYITVYSKTDIINWIERVEKRKLSEYKKKDDKGNFKVTKLAKWGNTAHREERPTMYFPIKDPDGNENYPIAPDNTDGRWRVGKSTMEELINNNLLFWEQKDDKWVPYEKEYYSEQDKILKERSILYDVANTGDGSDILTELFGVKDTFENPKPIELILVFLSHVLTGDDYVLDFFSGSGTSAHALFEYNLKQNQRNKFIHVQLTEHVHENKPAYKLGFKTIDVFGQERIRRAVKKIREENPMFADKMDLGFKHFTLRDVPQNTLDKMETFDLNGMFGDTDILKSFGAETVLATWMVKDGYGLTQNAEPLQLADYTAYHCGGHIYMIEGEGFDEKAMIALVDKYGKEPDFNPHNVVMFGYSFSFTQTEMLKKNLSAVKKLNERINIDIRY